MSAKPDHEPETLSARLRGLGSAAAAPGLAESAAPFETASHDSQRFNEAVRLARTFAAIERDEDRQLLLEIAGRLAAKASV